VARPQGINIHSLEEVVLSREKDTSEKFPLALRERVDK